MMTTLEEAGLEDRLGLDVFEGAEGGPLSQKSPPWSCHLSI